MENLLECLLEENLFFASPFILEWFEIGEIRQRGLKIVPVPQEHSQGLLRRVPKPLLRYQQVLLQSVTEREKSNGELK